MKRRRLTRAQKVHPFAQIVRTATRQLSFSERLAFLSLPTAVVFEEACRMIGYERAAIILRPAR